MAFIGSQVRDSGWFVILWSGDFGEAEALVTGHFGVAGKLQGLMGHGFVDQVGFGKWICGKS